MRQQNTAWWKTLWLSLAIAAVVVSLWLVFDRKPSFSEAPPNDYCTVEMINNDDGTPLPIRFELTRDQGIYATLIMTEKANRPSEIDGKFVEEYGMWMAVGNRTAMGEWPAEEPSTFRVAHYKDDFEHFKAKVVSPESRNRHRRLFTLGSVNDFRKDAGFHGEPERPISIPRNVRCAYTFFCQPWDAVPGDEFVVEVFLIPHAHEVSELRSIIGPKVLLWRGMMVCR
jgi:hypothetical protein